uniref:Secreted protein n=1 Tax=Strix occidentalis caurina TaxID=311401 RepID=A0A8D0F6W1_STROC
MMSVCLEVMLLCLFYHVLGENFDRQASIRRSLIYTDTVVRRPKKVKRRKTITGIPDNIQKELGMAHQNCIPSKYVCASLPPCASGN